MGKTADACNIDPIRDKFEAFNFITHELVNGHDEKKNYRAFKKGK